MKSFIAQLKGQVWVKCPRCTKFFGKTQDYQASCDKTKTNYRFVCKACAKELNPKHGEVTWIRVIEKGMYQDLGSGPEIGPNYDRDKRDLIIAVRLMEHYLKTTPQGEELLSQISMIRNSLRAEEERAHP